MTHTPTPWKVDIRGFIFSDAKDCVVAVGPTNDKGAYKHNAAFIVRAVNCHEELVECLKKLVSDMNSGMSLPSPTVEYEIKLALKAIAKAEGK